MCDKNNTDNKEFVLSENEQKEFDLYLKNLVINKEKHFNFGSLKISFEFLIKFISLSTIFGIILGGFNIYLYLKKINYLFLFPDSISFSNASISILVVYTIFFFIFSFGFLSTFFINMLLNNIRESFSEIKKSKNIFDYCKFIYWSISCFMILFTIIFIIFFIFKFKINPYFNYILYFLTSFLVLSNISYGFIFLKENKFYENKIDNIFYVFIISMLHTFPIFFHFIFVVIPTVNLFKHNIIAISFYIFSVFIFLVSLLCSFLSFNYNYRTKNYDYIFHILSALFVLMYLFFVSIFSHYEISLHKARFIEKYQDSSWYLIHNGNTVSETINGMTKDDIKKQKINFTRLCDASYADGDLKLHNKDNALYGYMAWNLGDTKVFCPASVDFFDGTDNTEKSKKCLVIDGRYLQLTSNYYIGNVITQ